MGRAYATEISELDTTFDWSLAASVEKLGGAILEAAGNSLLAVGSGGSLTSAHFATYLHILYTGCLAQVYTPYGLVSSSQSLGGSTVMVFSAGGSNPDVLSSVGMVANRNPRQLLAMTMRPNSKLEGLMNARNWPSCHAFDSPINKDGFLATNSLLATVMLLARAYDFAFRVTRDYSSSLDQLVHPGQSRVEFLEQIGSKATPVLERSTIVVLHGESTRPAAADFESRFTEAALANVQLADYRNFAHGRHHWIAKHAEVTSVLALCSPEDEKVAKQTLSLLPKSVPKLSVKLETGVRGAIAGIYQSMLFAHIAGSQRSIDPGRPHVPEFGRKLYHLKASPISSPGTDKLSERAVVAIERKSGLRLASLVQREELSAWLSSYKSFLERLSNSEIKAIVFDYDGTLCGPHRRLLGPTDEMIDKLKELLGADVKIAVATGRGKSVREVLHKRIRSTALRKRILVGYHNGAEVGTLDDLTCPPNESPLAESLQRISAQIAASSLINENTTVQAKGGQITLELHDCLNRTAMFDEVMRIFGSVSEPCVTVATSSHSIDILAPGVSKQSIVKRLESEGIKAESILCIGDRGKWPGNDTSLLSHSLSLSVDEVSSDPNTCWNLSDVDQRFDSACVEFLGMISRVRGRLHFNSKRLMP